MFPGSGKSYLLKEFSEIRNKKKIIFENKKNLNFFLKVFLILKFSIKNFIYIVALIFVNFFNKNLENDWKSRHYRWMTKEITMFEYCNNMNRVLIRSEGLHQRLLFYLKGKSKNKFNFFENLLIKYTPVPNKLIMIDISKKESIKNTNERQKGFKHNKKTLKELDRQIYIINKIKIFLKKNNRSNFILIKSRKGKSNLINNLKKLI